MATTGQGFVTEAFFRISGKLSRSAVLTYVNMAMFRIEMAAGWTWDLRGVYVTTNTVSAVPSIPAYTRFDIPSDADLGKEFWLFNNDGTPIARRQFYYGWPQETTTVIPPTFQQWELYGRTGILYPMGPATPQLQLVYHRVATALNDNSITLPPWEEPQMDSILHDYTEAYIKRILGMAGWEALEQKTAGLIVDAAKRFGSQRELPGMQEYATKPPEKV